MEDADRFPAPTYRETVLEPLFDATKTAFWDELMRINRAHGVMLAEQGICTADEIGAILGVLDEIASATDPSSLRYDGAVEDVFFHVERALIARLGVDLADKLHTGRSRNDIDHTVFKLKLKQRLDALLESLAALLDTLHDVASRHRETIIVAYTHGQPAQPSTFGHYLGAVIEVLLRDAERPRQARTVVDRCSMGAAAITTTGFDVDRERMAELLGFAAVQENAYGCIAACDYVTGTYAALKVMFVNLGRFVQDLNQWTGFEVGQQHVPDGYVQVFSIMPQKRDPVPVEHMRLIASLGAGHCDTIADTMHNTPFTDMNDSEGEVQVAGHKAFDAADRLLRLVGGFIAAVQVNEAKVQANIDATCITITELADTLVRREGISFRQAHEVAAALSREVVAGGATLSAVPYARFAAAFEALMNRAPTFDEVGFHRAITPEHFVAVRERLGGPGPNALAVSLDGYQKQIKTLRAELSTTHEHEALARGALDARVRHYTAQPVEA